MFSLFKTKIFLRLFLSCILFFIIPFMLLNVMVVSLSSKSYRSDMISLKLEYANNLRNNIDTQLTQINLTAEQLSDTQQVWNFNVKDKDYDYIQYIIAAKDVSDAIKQFSKYQESFYNTCLYFSSQDSVVSASTMSTLQEYHDMYLKNTLSFDEFKEIIKSPREYIFSGENENGESTVVLKKQLYGVNHKYSVILLSNINIQNMIHTHDILNAHDTLNSKQSESYTIITNDEDKVLFKSNTIPESINDSVLKPKKNDKVVKISKKYFAACQKSNVYPLNVSCVFSYDNMSENFYLMKITLYFILFLGILVFLYVSYRFTLRTFSPFKALISIGTQNNSLPYKVENYSQIKTLVLDIVNSNHKLSSLIESQRMTISKNLFNRLLQNSMELEEDSFNLMFEDYSKKFPYENFQVAVIHTGISNKDALTMLQFSFFTSLRNETEHKEIKHFVIPSSSKDMILLFNHGKNKNIIFELLENIIEPIAYKDLQLTIGVGRIVHSLTYFSKSYEDALCALYSIQENKVAIPNVFHYDGSESNRLQSIYFTNEDKQRIQQALVDGAVDDVNSIFDVINSRLFEKNIITTRTLSYVFFSLSNLLGEVIDNLEIHNETTDGYINKCQQDFSGFNYIENFKIIRDCFVETCKYVANTRTKSNTRLKEIIIDYIETHYNDPDISLHQISDNIHVSYNYLCRFFKDQLKVSFLQYLHSLRIEKSKELLKSTNKPINEIASELGYLNTDTFIRKFKQIMKITPGEYRKLL